MKTRIFFTHLWRDENYSNLTDEEKILFDYLITNGDIGLTRCYRLPKRTIKFDLNWTDEKVEKIKSILQKAKFFIFWEDWVFINNDFSYCDYQGGKTFNAKQREIKKIPKQFIECIDNMLPNHCPIIESINDKPEIKNQKKEQEIDKIEVNKRETINDQDKFRELIKQGQEMHEQGLPPPE